MQLYKNNGYFGRTAAALAATIGLQTASAQGQEQSSLPANNAAVTIASTDKPELKVDGFFKRWFQADINPARTDVFAIDPGLFTNFTYGDFKLETRLAWTQSFAPHADTDDVLGTVWLKGAKLNYHISDAIGLNGGKYDQTFGESWRSFNAVPNIYGLETGLFNLSVDETIGFGGTVATASGQFEGRMFWADILLNQRYSAKNGLSPRISRDNGGLANNDAPSFYVGYRGHEQMLTEATKLNFGGDLMYRQPGQNNDSGELRLAAHVRTDTAVSNVDSIRVFSEIDFLNNHNGITGAQQCYSTSSIELSHKFSAQWSGTVGATAGFQFGDTQDGSHLSAEAQLIYTTGRNTLTVGVGIKNESYRRIDSTTFGLIFSFIRSF